MSDPKCLPILHLLAGIQNHRPSGSLDACRATRLLNLTSCEAVQVDQRLHLKPKAIAFLEPTEQDFLLLKAIGRKMSDSIYFCLLLPSFTCNLSVHSSTIFPSFRNEIKTSIPKWGFVCRRLQLITCKRQQLFQISSCLTNPTEIACGQQETRHT